MYRTPSLRAAVIRKNRIGGKAHAAGLTANEHNEGTSIHGMQTPARVLMSGTIYSGPVFDMACRQFKDVADYLAIPEEERGRLLYPKRTVAVSCPIHRDDGTTEVFQGYRVQHHLTLGPTKGGTRFAVNVDIGEVAALAIWMSWKCALAGLPYGGAKGGIAVDPYSLSARELEALSRRYMQEMIPFVGPHTDVMAPDMGTNDQVMSWFMDTYSMYKGRTVNEIVTGKPIAAGGTLGRREATGRGIAHLVGRVLGQIGLRIDGATAIIQGFGNVGSVSAFTLAERGVKIIGVSDHTAAYHDPRGLDVVSMQRHIARHGVLRGFSDECTIDPSEMLIQRCDILIPAAVERVINCENADKLKCRVLAEGANGPTTPEADAILNSRRGEIFVLPDILLQCGWSDSLAISSGSKTCNAYSGTRGRSLNGLYRILDRSLGQMLERSRRDGVSHRMAAFGNRCRDRACRQTIPEVFSREVADVVFREFLKKRCGLGPCAMKSTRSFAIDIGEDNRPSEGRHSTRWGSLPERVRSPKQTTSSPRRRSSEHWSFRYRWHFEHMKATEQAFQEFIER
jgi:glutamate dehydrogenase (NAD(P)+)